MALPRLELPTIQHWDCHVSGSCCKEYLVTVSEEERQRILAQGWDPEKDLDGRDPFVRRGPPWARRYHLNHRPDGSCVFLSDQGRCRIHERFGYETKPLPCRLFPFVLVPQGDHWGVSVRFACPSAAANKGRALPDHAAELREFAEQLVKREGLTPQADGTLAPPPPLQAGQRVPWPDLMRFVRALLRLIGNRKNRLERRMRNCLELANLCRQARFDAIQGERLDELLEILATSAEAQTPREPASLPEPTWIGRVLFRQAAAIYTRKDHGPSSGLARQGRAALINAAWRFAQGTGPVPRMHNWMPHTTFEQVEAAQCELTPAAEEILERYYLLKIGSTQFCGAASFGMSFWEGLEHLALTLPILLWVARAFSPLPPDEAIIKALSIVDDHFGFNPVLASLRQRLSFKILARRGETSRLIAWYSRSPVPRV